MTKKLKGYSTDKVEIIKCKNYIVYRYVINNEIYEIEVEKE